MSHELSKMGQRERIGHAESAAHAAMKRMKHRGRLIHTGPLYKQHVQHISQETQIRHGHASLGITQAQHCRPCLVPPCLCIVLQMQYAVQGLQHDTHHVIRRLTRHSLFHGVEPARPHGRPRRIRSQRWHHCHDAGSAMKSACRCVFALNERKQYIGEHAYPVLCTKRQVVLQQHLK